LDWIFSYGYDQLYAAAGTGALETYSGLVGPDGISVSPGEQIVWTSDGDTGRSGFKICANPMSSGGGAYVKEGIVYFVDTNITDNSAILYGGGIYLDGGTVGITGGMVADNVASSVDGGQAFTFETGQFTATGLSMGYHSDISDAVTGGSQLSTECTSPCAAGEYGQCDNVTGTTDCFVNCACKLCPAGKISSVVGATSFTCTSCGAGLYSLAGDTSCSACAKGKYASDNATETGGGLLYQVSLAATSCNNCPAGYITSSSALMVCAACSAGTISASGESSCTDCEAGMYSLSGSSECSNCEAGTYSAGTGSGVCYDCSGDTYSSAGADACESCNRFFYYSVDGTCEECTEGMSCFETDDADGGDTQEHLRLEKNFWRIRATSIKIRACPLHKGCIGNQTFANGGDSYCATGYTGPLCAACDDGFYFAKDEGECLGCDIVNKNPLQLWLASPVLITISIAAVLALVYVVYKMGLRACFKLKQEIDAASSAGRAMSSSSGGAVQSAMDAWKGMKVKIKAFTSFAQISVNVGFSCGVSMPAAFNAAVGPLQVFNLAILPALGLNCHYSNYDYIDSMVVTTLVPLGVCASIMACVAVADFKKVFYAFLIFTFLILVSTSTVVLEFFQCEYFQETDPEVVDEAYLKRDYSVDCYSSRYKLFTVYAVIMVFVYPVRATHC
jgi:hypothetical protein